MMMTTHHPLPLLQRRALLALLLTGFAAPGAALAQATRGRDDELQHAAVTLSYGAASLEMSRLALDKTQRPAVRRFAEAEIAEQETLAEVLTLLTEARNTIAPQTQPKMQQRLDLDRMRDLSRGFDQAYVHHQIDGHRELLTLQERYLAKAQEPVFKAVALLARGHIREHLATLEVLKQDVREE